MIEVMEKLQKGDKVVMHSCIESDVHHGKIWTCINDEFFDKRAGCDIVDLYGFSGGFNTTFLQLVKPETNNNQEKKPTKQTLKILLKQ